MPLYEYECESCGHRFERIQKFSDPLVDVCPKCGGKVHKLISSPAIQFKGSGWYITDYSKKGSSESGKSSDSSSKDKAEKTEAGKSSTSTSEGSKPADTSSSSGSSGGTTDSAKPKT